MAVFAVYHAILFFGISGTILFFHIGLLHTCVGNTAVRNTSSFLDTCLITNIRKSLTFAPWLIFTVCEGTILIIIAGCLLNAGGSCRVADHAFGFAIIIKVCPVSASILPVDCIFSGFAGKLAVQGFAFVYFIFCF